MKKIQCSIITAVFNPNLDWFQQAAASIDESVERVGVEAEWIVNIDGGIDKKQVPQVNNLKQIVLLNTKQCGISNTRNMALAQATGEWVAALDQDDLFVAGGPMSLLQTAEKNGVAWIVGSSQDISSDNKPGHIGELSTGRPSHDPPVWRITPGELYETYMTESESNIRAAPPIHPCAGLISTDLVRFHGGWQALPYGEDIGLWFTVAALHEGMGATEVVHMWRRHDKQTTKAGREHDSIAELSTKSVRQRIQVAEKLGYQKSLL